MSEEWKSAGLCAQTDPEAFYPDKGECTREAKRICLGCEVREQCLEYALAHNEQYGIWGGLSIRERLRIKRGQVAPLAAIDDVSAARICRGCGRSFTGGPRDIYCGDECRGVARASTKQRSKQRRAEMVARPRCKGCGGEIRGRGRSSFCSDHCEVRTCADCGRPTLDRHRRCWTCRRARSEVASA